MGTSAPLGAGFGEIRGLTEAEARRRRAAGQGNRVPAASSRTVGAILRGNFLTLFNGILVAAVVLLLAVGQVRDAVLTGGLVLFTVAVSTAQEFVAKARLDRIALLNRAPVRVIRDGRERELDPADVVHGDSLVLRRGEQAVADGTLVAGDGLEMSEAVLTGETEPARKSPGDPVLSGSYCVAGSGVCVAERVGRASYVQQLTAEGRRYRHPRTPLLRTLDRVLRVLLVVVVGLSLLQALGFVLQGSTAVDSVRATAVMVTLVPQGLLLMSTVAYSLGAVRVARKGALVQRLSAVEGISHVDVLCLDKTGTLTSAALAYRGVEPAPGRSAAEVERLLGAFAASAPEADATTLAIARALGGDRCAVLGAVRFSSERKWSALALAPPGPPGTLVLGAPEMLLPHLRGGEELVAAIRARELGGQRVLLLALAPPALALADSAGQPRLVDGLEALGLAFLEEEIRPDAAATLAAFAEQGVAVKLISGDNPRTVLALARRVGIPPEAKALSGAELAATPAEQLSDVVEATTIFGRVTPQQKRDIVRVLKARGHRVAMVGDGANDVLGLKEADLGVAMRGGTAAARGVADLVLLDDSFAVLPRVVREGRRIGSGMMIALKLFLARDAATIGLIVASAFVGAPFPLLPPHAALIAFLTVGLPALFVVARARPRMPGKRALAQVTTFALWVGAASALAILGAYALELAHFESDVGEARTTVVTTALLAGVVALVLAQGSVLGAPIGGAAEDRRALGLALAMLLAYVVVVYAPPARAYFELTPLLAVDWLIGAVSVAGWFGAMWLAVRTHAIRRLLS